MRRNITAAMTPMKKAVQANALSIPVHGDVSTGLRVALSKATRIQILGAGANIGVRLIVDGKKMPKGQESLPGYVEGDAKKPWAHPVFGPHNSKTWVTQPSHPIVAPAIPKTVIAAERGVRAAVEQTAVQLEKGTP